MGLYLFFYLSVCPSIYLSIPLKRDVCYHIYIYGEGVSGVGRWVGGRGNGGGGGGKYRESAIIKRLENHHDPV